MSMKSRRSTLAKAGRLLPGVLLPAAMLLWPPLPAWSVQEYPSNSEHRGVVVQDMYQIFPENRPGNAVYYDKRLIFSLADRSIRHIAPLPREGRFAYLAVDSEGRPEVGIYVQHQDHLARLVEIGAGYYFAVVTLDGVIYKKMYRVIEGERIEDLLSESKTADGAVNGAKGVVFYHVATVVEREGEGGDTYTEFGIRVHLSLRGEERLRHLDYPIFNTLPKLTLSWSEDNQITYTLADGRREVLSLSQFQ